MTHDQRDTVIRLLHDEGVRHEDRTFVMNIGALRHRYLTVSQVGRLVELAEKYPAKDAKRRRQY